MITKSELQHYASLIKRKDREIEGKFIVEGPKSIEEGLVSHYFCEILFCTQDFYDNAKDFFKTNMQKLKNIEVLSDQDFNKVSNTVTPQGVLGIFKKKEKKLEIGKFKQNTVLYLDCISDPGNLGTIIRTCDWFNFNEIILSYGCTDAYSPKCVRSSMGSIFHVNVYPNQNLKVILPFLKQSHYKIVSMDLNGENFYEHSFAGKSLIILSNEANGPSQEVIEVREKILTIPRLGKAESLNVATAGTIVLSKAAEFTLDNEA
ncbi:MAG: RNA methyltransferase [Bacteroidota bacterium]|nr:RNA methyltransferase [Bacteroidota bacterium]